MRKKQVSIEEAVGDTGRIFFIFHSQTDLDRANNVAVDRGQCLVEQPLCSGDL
jgi:hypothetical protein